MIDRGHSSSFHETEYRMRDFCGQWLVGIYEQRTSHAPSMALCEWLHHGNQPPLRSLQSI
jgi:hypothetical protein